MKVMKKPAKSKIPNANIPTAKKDNPKTDQLSRAEHEPVEAEQVEREEVRAEDMQTKPVEAEPAVSTIQAGAVTGLCDGFINSDFYRKAMLQPGYLREEAIRDFLISLNEPFDVQLIDLIRKSYYRSF